MTTIELAGIELWGFHGLLEHERSEGQRFLFDVELSLADSERIARTDVIGDTVDYREAVACVRGGLGRPRLRHAGGARDRGGLGAARALPRRPGVSPCAQARCRAAGARRARGGRGSSSESSPVRRAACTAHR